MSSTLTQKDETLDDIVYRIYGDNAQMLAPLIAANAQILGLGVHLPEGVEVNLPAVTASDKTVPAINLWD